MSKKRSEDAAGPTKKEAWTVEWITYDEALLRSRTGRGRVIQFSGNGDQRTWHDYASTISPPLAAADRARLEAIRADVVAKGIRTTGVDHMRAKEPAIPFVAGAFIHLGENGWENLMAAIWTAAGTPSRPDEFEGDRIDDVLLDRKTTVLICMTGAGGTPIGLAVTYSKESPEWGHVVLTYHMGHGDGFLCEFQPGDPLADAVRAEDWENVARLVVGKWRARKRPLAATWRARC